MEFKTAILSYFRIKKILFWETDKDKKLNKNRPNTHGAYKKYILLMYSYIITPPPPTEVSFWNNDTMSLTQEETNILHLCVKQEVGHRPISVWYFRI